LFEEEGAYKFSLSIPFHLSSVGTRYSLLPGLSLDGILHVSIVEGSFTASRFYTFIEGLLNKMQPFPQPNSVIVMDNARIHKDPRILDLIESRYVPYIVDKDNITDMSAQRDALHVLASILPRLQSH
jgi:hypothetical protein